MKKDLLSIVGLIVGLIGIFLSIYFYEMSSKEKEPTFIIDPLNLKF